MHDLAAPTPASRARAGFTLLELTVVVGALAALAALTAPPVARQLDRLAVTAATAELAALLAGARDRAIAESRPFAVRLDGAGATLHAGPDSLRRLDLAGPHRVSLAATRDSLAYGAGGLAVGASNLSVVVRRGRAAETLFVARLGRVRW